MRSEAATNLRRLPKRMLLLISHDDDHAARAIDWISESADMDREMPVLEK